MRLQAATNVALKDVLQRLTRIEEAIVTNTQNLPTVKNDNLISTFLPLNTIDEIKQFDLLLSNTAEAVKQFVSPYIYFYNL